MPIGANNPVIQRYRSLLQDVGKETLNALFPNDFEAYIMSLELVDADGNTVDFFVFPIMPNSIAITNTSLTNIKKTAGGITTLDTITFIPIDFAIQGNFGRQFKFLVGRSDVSASAINFNARSFYLNADADSAATQIKKAVFNSQIKTGYGCIKILESIIKKSRSIDAQGRPYSLYFYNPSFGDAYLIKVPTFTFNQSKEENMIWNYSLQIKAIAPIDTTRNGDNRNSLIKTMQYATLGKAMDITASTLQRQLTSIPNKPLINTSVKRNLNFIIKKVF